MARYRFAELRREWNRKAKSESQIRDYQALKEEARITHSISGHRRIEMRAYEAKSGHTEALEF